MLVLLVQPGNMFRTRTRFATRHGAHKFALRMTAFLVDFFEWPSALKGPAEGLLVDSHAIAGLCVGHSFFWRFSTGCFRLMLRHF